jgi:tetraprenyl-beta-curcumene synthase
LKALTRKRANIDGAALFWIIPATRNLDLLKLLVSYQIMWDLLDSVSETGASAGQQNARHLHLALVHALDERAPITDYYRHHPDRDDGGYLRSLVHACRQHTASLASYKHVRLLLLREARRANVQAINHELDPARREMTLRAWTECEYPDQRAASWFELAAAAGAGLSIYALFALAAEPGCHLDDPVDAYHAYFPWVSALATMLDSYVDQAEDTASGDHVYIDYYTNRERTILGLGRLVRRSLTDVRTLPRGERHAVVVSCMIAMYLSKDSARTPDMAHTTTILVNAGGSLTRLMLPVLRLWRLAYGQRSR